MSEGKIQVRMYNDGWVEWKRDEGNDWSCVQITELIRFFEDKTEDAEIAYQKGWHSGYLARDLEEFSRGK